MRDFLHACLVAWLFALGISLGAWANLMVLSLTGGRWAGPVLGAWRAAAAAMPGLALLFIPLALGARWVWPWVDEPGAWLNLPFFLVRSAIYLALWCGLSQAWLRAAGVAATRRWSAAGLIVYAFTISLAAIDWIASLVPAWYSSGFGLLVATGQMLSGAAFGVAIAARPLTEIGEADRRRFHDLGNLLLMYVLTWAYLAYTQFAIIWSENLPREIAWYVPRMQTGWAWVGLALVAFHFATPFAILLSRRAKRTPRTLFIVASALLVMHGVQVAWLVLPSVRSHGFVLAWSDPLAAALVIAASAWLWRRAFRRDGARAQSAEWVHG
jgi:hypothetical protein